MQSHQPLKRVVITASEQVVKIEELLRLRHPNVNEKRIRHMLLDILYLIVESVRERDNAWTNIFHMCVGVQERCTVTFEFNIDKVILLRNTIKDLAVSVYEQVSIYGLYNNHGRLPYVMYRVYDEGFKDIVLSNLIQLTWSEPYYVPAQSDAV